MKKEMKKAVSGKGSSVLIMPERMRFTDLTINALLYVE
jgi:hypothetical protein